MVPCRSRRGMAIQGGVAGLPILDGKILAALRRVETVAGAGLVREVIATFLGPLDAKVAKAREHASRGDAVALEAAAHALRGAAAQLGAAELAAACERLEEAGRSGNLAKSAALIQDLEQAAARARAALAEVP